MRIIAQFSKGEQLKYISHLDLLRVFQRALRRAGIPVLFSKGFNPHMEISFATALPVGAKSECECIDIHLSENINTDEFISKLNSTLPIGLNIIRVRLVEQEYPRLMAIVERAEYRFGNLIIPSDVIDKFLAQTEILADKSTKKGIKQIDIRPHIHSCSYDETKSELTVTLSTGELNIRPELFLNALLSYAGISNSDVDILRIALLTLKGDKWVNLLDL